MSNPSVKTIDSAYVPVDYARPVLIQDRLRALLYFTGREMTKKERVRVVAIFNGCLASRFGYPNDEALRGHPLHEASLRFNRFFEVSNSPWMDEIIQQNKVSFPNYAMPRNRHFIITLHDETFEILANNFELHMASEISPQTLLPNFNRTD